jgi:hypothetical protein
MKKFALLGVFAVVGASLAMASAAWADPSADCNGQPCVRGFWYTAPVTVSWELNGGSTVAGCSTQSYATDTNQSGLPENPAEIPAWTYCTTSVSGGTATQFYFLQLELSSPTATVGPSRAPDSNGWYNHPVAGAVNATSFSGIASCTSTTYAGPNTTSATVSGTCTDNAGKSVTVTSAPFAYDATPPSLAATATAGDQSVALSWQAGGDIAPIVGMTVARTSSAGSGDPVVYSGGGGGFEDTHLKNGVHYTYTITAEDAAGNSTTRTVRATPDARLLSPAPNAQVTAPPALSWTAVPGATYYNVQLYRDDPAKLLSLWPSSANLQLHRTWRFNGRRYRLKPGRYKWYVWPGFGKRKAAHYGHVIGSGTFVVVR